VCNGVLQLALQQCVRYQQQPLEHLHVSKGALQLLEAAQRLLRFASVAGFAEVRQQLSCPAGATSTSEADTDAATSWMTSQERLDSTRLLFVLLHTGFVRLFALQEAASAVAAAALRRQEAMRAGQGAAGGCGGSWWQVVLWCGVDGGVAGSSALLLLVWWWRRQQGGGGGGGGASGGVVWWLQEGHGTAPDQLLL